MFTSGSRTREVFYQVKYIPISGTPGNTISQSRNELQMLKFLEGPSWPAYVEHFCDQDYVYIVTTCRPSRTLEVLLHRQKKLKEDRARGIIRQVLEALAQLQGRGLVYGCLGPTRF